MRSSILTFGDLAEETATERRVQMGIEIMVDRHTCR